MGRQRHDPTPRSRPQDEHAAEHAALASPTRVRLLEALRRMPRGGHPDELADDLGLHPNTVRGHLTLLVEAGFAQPVIERRPRPGRPRVLFVPTTKELPHAVGCHRYRGLAKALSSYLTWEEGAPTETGIRVGWRWAVDVARVEASTHRAAPSVARIGELLGTAGFLTEVAVDLGDVVLVHPVCPFAEMVEEGTGIMCAIHLGLAEGVIEQVTGRWEVAELTSSIDERTCMVRLRRRPATNSLARDPRAGHARRSGDLRPVPR